MMSSWIFQPMNFSVYPRIYIYIYVCVCVCVWEREREREREGAVFQKETCPSQNNSSSLDTSFPVGFFSTSGTRRSLLKSQFSTSLSLWNCYLHLMAFVTRQSFNCEFPHRLACLLCYSSAPVFVLLIKSLKRFKRRTPRKKHVKIDAMFILFPPIQRRLYICLWLRERGYKEGYVIEDARNLEVYFYQSAFFLWMILSY